MSSLVIPSVIREASDGVSLDPRGSIGQCSEGRIWLPEACLTNLADAQPNLRDQFLCESEAEYRFWAGPCPRESLWCFLADFRKLSHRRSALPSLQKEVGAIGNEAPSEVTPS